MAVDKLVDSTKLNNSLEYTADRIRLKTGGSADIPFDFDGETGFGDAIDAITTGGSGAISISDTTDSAGGTVRTITALTVEGTKSITANGTGIDVASYAKADVNVASQSTEFLVTLTYSSSTDMWTPDCTIADVQTAYNANKTIRTYAYEMYNGYECPSVCEYDSGSNALTYSVLYNVSYQSGLDCRRQHVYILDSNGVTDDGYTDYVNAYMLQSKTITSNGTYNAVDESPYPLYGYSSVIVNVPSSSPNLQAKTNISPTTSSQTIQPDSGYDGLSSVQINAMPSGTTGTPTATKGTVSNHSISVTPSVTNTTGYITGSTKTGTAVTVNVTELESGTKTITNNGTGISVSGYSTVDVAVPTGSSKAIYTYSGLASRTANSYGSTNATVTVTKAGTYNISYVAVRGSSQGAMGTNLHIGSTSGTNNTTWNSGTYGQSVTLSNQTISANTAVTIYATSASNSRTIYVGQLIVEEV